MLSFNIVKILSVYFTRGCSDTNESAPGGGHFNFVCTGVGDHSTGKLTHP